MKGAGADGPWPHLTRAPLQPTNAIGTREERTAKKNKSGGQSRWRNFFKNISFAQIAASGLSAITVFFLTAKIGLAGSIIGAALASIISTISSQLYKNVIDESSKRIKGNRDDGQDEENKDEKEKEGRREERRSVSAPIYLEQDELPAQFSPHLPPRLSSAHHRHAKPTGRTVSSSSTVVPASPRPPVKSFRKERRKTKKKVIAVSIISSLLTLVVVCGIILFVTGGKGTDVFIRDALNRSKSIKEDAQKLTNQAEEKGSSASSPASSASSSGSLSVSPSAPSSPPASQSPSATSSSSETKSQSDSGSASNSSSTPSQSGEKTEEKQPSATSSSPNSSSQQGGESGKEKDKKSPSATSSDPSSSGSNTADQNFKKD